MRLAGRKRRRARRAAMITSRSLSAQVNYWQKSGNTCPKRGIVLLQCMSPLLAQSRHHSGADPCPLLGVKRTSIGSGPMSAFDPKRTPRHPTTWPTAAHRMSYCGQLWEIHESQRCQMIIKHDGATPRIDPAAWIAPNAVICGNVTIGPGCRVMFGAQVIAEGGSISVGRECIIMENSVLRSSARHSLS